MFCWAAPRAVAGREVEKFMLNFTELISPIGIIPFESHPSSTNTNSCLPSHHQSWGALTIRDAKESAEKKKKENSPKQLLQRPIPLFCDSFTWRNLLSEYFIHLERGNEYHFVVSSLGGKESDVSGPLLKVPAFLCNLLIWKPMVSYYTRENNSNSPG